MFNLDKFIPDSVTFRPVSMFVPDIEANKDSLTKEIKDKNAKDAVKSIIKQIKDCNGTLSKR